MIGNTYSFTKAHSTGWLQNPYRHVAVRVAAVAGTCLTLLITILWLAPAVVGEITLPLVVDWVKGTITVALLLKRHLGRTYGE